MASRKRIIDVRSTIFILLVLSMVVYVPAFIAPPDSWAQENQPETLCNSVDDDGDGIVDDGFDVGGDCNVQTNTGCWNDGSKLIEKDIGDCSQPTAGCWTIGKKVCTEDQTSVFCQATVPPPSSVPEVLGTQRCFDGIDNDCDGLIDFADPDCQTSNEIGLCNGLDDDHDVQIDEDFLGLGTPCSVGVYDCARQGIMVCKADMKGIECNARSGLPSPENTPGTGNCVDGIDNDCDGLIDIVDRDCQSPELCDGKDNDGDGQVDEDFTNLRSPCSTGIGACTSEGIFICSPDQMGTVCNAIPLLASAEGPDGVTCSDMADNDCDGLTDLTDPSCASAELAVYCALIPYKESKGKRGDPGTSCEGKFTVQFSSNAEPEMVTAEMLALDVDGSLLGSMPVQNGNLVHLASRIDPEDYKLDMNGQYLDVFAPVPLLRVTANTGQKVEYAYCSPLPYLDVIQPSGNVVSASDGNVIKVLVAIPRVDPKTLAVKVDGVDILDALGVNPVNDFPGGPYEGIVNIKGYQVSVSDLMVQVGSLFNLSANTLTMKLENLGGGAHIIVVDGEPLSSAVPSPISAECYRDDIRDTGAVTVFGIEIYSPAEGEVTSQTPMPVVGKIFHGRPITSAMVNGLSLDVSGQIFTPGDGESSADEYVLPINILLPLSNLSLPPQLGRVELGQNDLIAGAADDQDNLTFLTRRFTLGNTAGPIIESASPPSSWPVPMQAQQGVPAFQPLNDVGEPGSKIDNAILFGISKDGVNDFFSSVCAAASEAVKNATDCLLTNYNVKIDEIDTGLPVCKPQDILVDIQEVSFGDGNFQCEAIPEEGKIRIAIKVPDTLIDKLHFEGQCRDAPKIIIDNILGVPIDPPIEIEVCLSEVLLNLDVKFTLKGLQLGFSITEELAKNGGDSPKNVIQEGTVELPVEIVSNATQLNCFIGDLVELINDIVTSVINIIDPNFPGLIDYTGIVERPFREGDIDIPGMLKNQDNKDPLSIQIIGPNGDPIALDENIKLQKVNQDGQPEEKPKPVSLEITSDGVTGTFNAAISVTEPAPDAGDSEAVLTPVAGIPTMPIPGAKEVLYGVSDDLFNMLYAALNLRGALQNECVAADPPLTVEDLLPHNSDGEVDCDSLQTATKRGKCHAFTVDNKLGCNNFTGQGHMDGEVFPCRNAFDRLLADNIRSDMPLLFCLRPGVPPRILIKDKDPSDGVVETNTRFSNKRVTLVLDRGSDAGLDQDFAATRNCFLNAETSADCKLLDECTSFEIESAFTAELVCVNPPACTESEPQLTPDVIGVIGNPTTDSSYLCDGQDLGYNLSVLADAGADGIEVIKKNLNVFAPLLQAKGLRLGGFVKFLGTPMAFAIGTGHIDNCAECYDYIGLTGDIEPQRDIENLCNGIDDDGDGTIDEGFGVGSKCIKEGDTTCSPTGIKACSDDHTGTICQ